jgi:aryl carrier-like protein
VASGGAVAGVGQRGEVVVRGRQLATGYLDGTGVAGRFVPDPLGQPGVRAFRTGDLGRTDPHGVVHLDGRLDRQVLVDGFRVAPEEVEAAALAHPGVAQALVAASATPAGEVLRLQVVPEPGATVGVAALRAHLRALLPGHAVPAVIEPLPALGTTANHKPAPAEPGTPLGRLADLARQTIGRDLGPDENFFDAGLTSIGLLRLHGQLLAEFGDRVTVSTLFAHPNLRAIAGYLAPGTTEVRTRPGRAGRGRHGAAAEARRRIRHHLRHKE